AAREIFAAPTDILAWGAINHEVQVVPGGYRATARWDFASGCRQASWLGAHVQIVEADGTRRRKPDGAPEVRTILFPVESATLHENNAVQGAIGRLEGNLRAARAYLYATADEAWRDLTQTGNLGEQHRIALRLASTWTIHQAASVVDTAYHMAGATAVFRTNKFERRFRDMHAIAQQVQARNTHYEDVGKAILGNSSEPPAKDT